MLEQLKKIHLKVERFFEAMRREASLGRMLGAWFFVVLLLGVFSTVFDYFDFGLFLLVSKYKFSWVVSSFVGHVFSFVLLTLLVCISICLAVRVCRAKTDFLKLFYALSVSVLLAYGVCLALVLLFAVAGISPALALLLSRVLTLYLVLTVFKISFKTTWSIAFGMLIVVGIISSVLYLIGLNAYIIYMAHNYAVKINSGVVLKDSFELSNENGTVALTIITQNGKSCFTQFPSGWRSGNESDATEFFAGKKLGNYSDSKNRLLFKGESFNDFTQRMAITRVYPVEVLSSNKKTCEETWSDYNKNVIQKMSEDGFRLSNYTYRLYEERLLKTCDAEFANENNGETRHVTYFHSLNSVGIDLEYSSKTSESDLQYVMKSFECN